MTFHDRSPRPGGSGPRPRMLSVIVPLAVLTAIGAVVLWSALPLVRPARRVTVVQAMFDRSAEPAPDAEGRLVEKAVPAVQAPGWLEAEPYFVACTALADGVVETIEALEGDFVEKGQVVARMVAEDSQIRLRSAEAELANARAALAIAEAELAAAEGWWEEPVELERAASASGAALAESEAELAQLPWLIDSAKATLARLADELARVRTSSDRGAASAFELVAIQQREAAQRAEVGALEARRPLLEHRVARLRAEQRAAERNLSLRIDDRLRVEAARGGVATAEAMVARAVSRRDEAALELERMTIRAPISGFVQRRLKAPGDKVIRMSDDPYSAHIAHLYDPAQLRVRVDVPLADAAHVSIGQRCEVVVEVLPDRVFEGEALRMTHEADLQKNTLEIQVKVLDPDPILRPEMLTRVKFLPPSRAGSKAAPIDGEEASEALVPEAAIDEQGERPRVWLVTDRRGGRGTLASETVRVLAREGGWARVSGAIRPGDLLAVGLAGPRAGERVVIASDAAEAGRAP